MVEAPGIALVVIPHPDDAEGWCGGTVASWIGQGTKVFYVLCTDGSKGSDDPSTDPAQLAATREQEQMDAAEVLGVEEVVLLHHPDGELEDNGELRREIVRAIRRFRPDVILCPDPYRRAFHWHRDHRITGLVTADAAFPYARDFLHFHELYAEEGLEPHKTGMCLFWAPDVADTYVDIGEVLDVKARALSCHKSQISKRPDRDVAASVRDRAKAAAEGSDCEYAEAYRKLEFRR